MIQAGVVSESYGHVLFKCTQSMPTLNASRDDKTTKSEEKPDPYDSSLQWQDQDFALKYSHVNSLDSVL